MKFLAEALKRRFAGFYLDERRLKAENLSNLRKEENEDMLIFTGEYVVVFLVAENLQNNLTEIKYMETNKNIMQLQSGYG